MSKSNLIPVTYYSAAAEIRLSAYADVIVYEPEGGTQTLRAIRLGGYPEAVRAMADAIYGGGTITADTGGATLRLTGAVKQYDRRFSHDGVYAEATLLAKDDAQKTLEDSDPEEEGKNPPRRCTVFCPAGDKDRLFAQIDHKTAVPLIPDVLQHALLRGPVLIQADGYDDVQRFCRIGQHEAVTPLWWDGISVPHQLSAGATSSGTPAASRTRNSAPG